MVIKTAKKLESEWGLDRYCNALRDYSVWMQNKARPLSVEQLTELKAKNHDAFVLCGVLTFELAKEVNQPIYPNTPNEFARACYYCRTPTHNRKPVCSSCQGKGRR